jgi:hypothetical protein
MHHLEIEIEQRKAERAEAAMAHLRRRSPLGADWDDQPGGDGPFDFGDEADVFDDPAAEHARPLPFDIAGFAKAYNEILDDADREARELDRTADYYLESAASEMADRAASRDTEDGERSMARAVTAFNALYGHDLSETEGWQFMSILKKSRSAEGAYREDDHAALAAEAAWEAQ